MNSEIKENKKIIRAGLKIIHHRSHEKDSSRIRGVLKTCTIHITE